MEDAALNGAAQTIQREWRRFRACQTCIICLDHGDMPLCHMGCACRGPSALVHLNCLVATAKAVHANTGCGYHRCGVCHQDYQGLALTTALGAQADHTAGLPNENPHRISAIVALARETAEYDDVDPGETFKRVLQMKRNIDQHPMAFLWVPDVYHAIAMCLKRLGCREQAVAQCRAGLARVDRGNQLDAGEMFYGGAQKCLKSCLRMGLLCAKNHIEAEESESALEILTWVTDTLQFEWLTWSSGTVSVHLAPLMLWVARWMHALQTGDDAARCEAQTAFEQAFSTVRRTFGSSHCFTLKWIEWRTHLLSSRAR